MPAPLRQEMSGNLPVRSLTDIPGLEELSSVCRRFNVNITAFGSLVRHLVALHSDCQFEVPSPNHVLLFPQRPFSLFDLVPFTSDIDLIHSGDDSLTEEIQQTLLNVVPCAECFRWQVISHKENQERLQSLRCSAIIPANLLTLSTHSRNGIFDPWEGVSDIRGRHYRFIRNGFYHESPLFQSHRDLEIFSSLHYCRMLLHSGVQDVNKQPGFISAQQIVIDAVQRSDTVQRLQVSDYLRARLRYLFYALSGYFSIPSSAIINAFAFDEFIKHLSRTCPGILAESLSALFRFEQNMAVVVPSWLGGDLFRCKDRVRCFAQIGSSISPFYLQQVEGIAPITASEDITLAEHQLPIFCTEDIGILKGIGMCSSTQPLASFHPVRQDEFLHIAIPTTLNDIAVEDLACVLVVTDDASSSRTVASLPSVAHLMSHDDGFQSTLYLRINCFGVLSALGEYGKRNNVSVAPPLKVQVLVLRLETE